MIKVLYAEDDLMIARMCKSFLEGKGYRVIHAENGNKAWQIYRDFDPDVVLLDVMMPEKDGFEVARLIRMENARVPILFISSLASSSYALEAFHLGASDYIRKEYLLEEVEVRMQLAIKAGKNRPDEGIVNLRLSECTVLNIVENELVVNGVPHKIYPMEARVLRLLYQHLNTVVKKNVLMNDLWGNDFESTSRGLDKIIVKLRKILKDDPALKIVTTWRVGLSLVRREGKEK